jgi:tRNA-specific 2-thiouridylase
MSVRKEKVIVAMSGGVDSSVAAGMLLEAGYEVTGAFLCLGSAGPREAASRGCCSPTDAADARRVAQTLGIELFVLDYAEAFGPIVEDFVGQYAAGRTPNPCIHCNRDVKFGRLMDRADSLGIRYVATGHHARIAAGPGGKPAIARGRAWGKDQSYALFAIPRGRLGRILLPIGEIADKDLVRSRALDLGLSVHDKPDSQEICFVPDDDYTELLARLRPEALAPGQIVDAEGRVLGTHAGYARYTIGQRRGLGVAAGVPMYVTGIDPATARVTIGPREQTMCTSLTAGGANWHADVRGQFEATVQIRYNHRGAPGRVTVTGPDSFAVEFAEPVHAITPGQAAVVYDGLQMLGGGWIDAAGGRE